MDIEFVFVVIGDCEQYVYCFDWIVFDCVWVEFVEQVGVGVECVGQQCIGVWLFEYV